MCISHAIFETSLYQRKLHHLKFKFKGTLRFTSNATHRRKKIKKISPLFRVMIV